ncbi:MAG TPA: hypothetical protein VFW39_11875 [Sphingomicrobium sp.]|nr:hypothetical protein [Sphingomicrobium sp.]
MIGRAFVVGALLAAFANGGARAGDDTVTIAGGKVNGAATVNVAAGNTNQQANAGLIATGGDSAALAILSQKMGDVPDSNGRLSATIAPGSFAGSSGWLAVNGAAGAGDQQANLAIIALGTTGAALSDAALSQARASHEPTGGPGTGAVAGDRSVAIGDGAFANSSGLVQVSLIGGDRNSSANIFALSASAGANH